MDERTEINIDEECEMVQCKKCVKSIPVHYAYYCRYCYDTYCSNMCWYKSSIKNSHIKCLFSYCIKKSTSSKTSSSYSSLPSY